MNEARRHAVTASEYLNALDHAADLLRDEPPESRLMRVATGQVERLNRDMEWTARCATAHALCAIALTVTLDDDALDSAPEGATYEVVKFWRDPDKDAEVIEEGLSLDDARAICNDPATTNLAEGWFYGYRREEA